MDRLRRMNIFVAIAEAKQFTRAAETLGLTKSAISHSMSDLEGYLGVQLVQRGSRGIELTEAGHDYYKRCIQILSDIDDMEDSTRNVDNALSGRIKITAPTIYGIQNIVPYIASFSLKYPDIKLILDLSERHVGLTEEQVDVAVRISNIDGLTPLMEPLGYVRPYLCASPDFLKTHGPINTLEKLKNVNCLLYSGVTTWSFLDTSGKVISFQPNGRIIMNNGVAIRELAIAGTGVTYLPDFLADEALASGKLVQFSIEGLSALNLRSYLLFPPNRHRPLRVRKFVEFLKERFTA